MLVQTGGIRLLRPLRRPFTALAFLIAFHCAAQLQTETPITLDSSEPHGRQVTGLAPPTDPGDAVSLGSMRTLTMNTVSLAGSSQLTGNVVPAPAAYTTGMIITVVATSTVADGATIELNGLGPKAIVRSGGVPILSGDIRVGIPSRLIYDGVRFQLLSSTQLPCPSGFSIANERYCIADQPLPAATFFDAINTCAAQGARLCTISEWSHACRSIPGFFATVTEAEWVDHAANNNTGAKLVGFGIDGSEAGPGSGCEYGGQVVPTTPYRFRCCSNR
jgi:hypothetical protein